MKLKKIWLFILSIAPGIFCIGYTVGTGSVTTMATSGSWFGMNLGWALLLACLFGWAMMEASGRYGIVTGKTAIYSFRTEMGKFGPFIGILTIIGITLGQWACYSGIVALSSNGLYETINIYYSGLPKENYAIILIIAILMLVFMYSLIFVGKYSFFEKILLFFVTFMGLAFILSFFVALPKSDIGVGSFVKGFIPNLPHIKTELAEKVGINNIFVQITALVGTTMAAPTFVVRPLLMKGHGWTEKNIPEQRRDAIVASILVFIVSGAIMATSAMVLHENGLYIKKVTDMVQPLVPLLGRFAIAAFMLGLISAGLSSTFPIMMVAALLWADYDNGELDTSSKRFKILCAIACVFGLIVPILGYQPIFAQIVTQIFNVLILPVVVGGFLYLVNRKDLMKKYKAGIKLNIILVLALIFTIAIDYFAVIALISTFKGIF